MSIPRPVEAHERRAAPAAREQFPADRTSVWWQHPRAIQIVATLALLAGAVYLTWRIGWSGRGTELPIYLALLAAEVFGWCSLALYAFLAWSVPTTPRSSPGRIFTVDVFVCTYDEPVHIVEATLLGCRAVTTPHVTHLLDDGDRPEMAELAKRLGARYVTRPEHDHAKAGNINHALTVTEGDLILVLDADHVPLPSILDATIGAFDDPTVALVQTPHDFSNRDSVQHTQMQRNEQSLFYRVIAPAKNRHNAMFWCGSAAVIRRDALIDVGGVLTDTVAEDFHTTIAMHANGWTTRYHDEVLVQGRAPHDLDSFLLQRARWARGNLAVFRTKQNPLRCRGLTGVQRTSYFASLFNYFGGLQRLTLLLVLTVTLATGILPMHANLGVFVAVWLPWSVLAFTASLALGRDTLGPLDSTRYGLMTMGIFVRGVVAMAFRSAGSFKVTPKEGVDRGGIRVFRLLGATAAIGIVLLAAWTARLLAVLGVVELPALPDAALVIVLALGVWELFGIGRTLLPLALRRQRRSRYRVEVDMRARIDGTTIRVDVADITPEGLAFNTTARCTPGTSLTLLTRLPGVDGRLHDVALPAEVRSCAGAPDGPWHVGCKFTDLHVDARDRLVEFCEIVLPSQQLGQVSEPTATSRRAPEIGSRAG